MFMKSKTSCFLSFRMSNAKSFSKTTGGHCTYPAAPLSRDLEHRWQQPWREEETPSATQSDSEICSTTFCFVHLLPSSQLAGLTIYTSYIHSGTLVGFEAPATIIHEPPVSQSHAYIDNLSSELFKIPSEPDTASIGIRKPHPRLPSTARA